MATVDAFCEVDKRVFVFDPIAEDKARTSVYYRETVDPKTEISVKFSQKALEDRKYFRNLNSEATNGEPDCLLLRDRLFLIRQNCSLLFLQQERACGL